METKSIKNTRPLYQELAIAYAWVLDTQNNADPYWEGKALDRLDAAIDLLPAGAGIDNGFVINHNKSKRDRIEIDFSYHHMNEHGMYTNWSYHSVVITPGWSGPEIRITGSDSNGVKEYLGDLLYAALSDTVSVAY